MGFMRLLTAFLLAGCLAGIHEAAGADKIDLTFYGWSDQHIATDGNADHVVPFVDAMNVLEGTPYPPGIGGRVAKPKFVIGAGDITEWPTHAAMRAYDSLLRERLTIPAYDVLGNHDDGGKVASETMMRWARKRHGSLSYTFDEGGVRFIALWSKFDPDGKPAQPLTPESLRHLKQELGKVKQGQPIVIVTHLCHDAMTNKDDLVKTIGDANVILILGGHYHYARVNQYKGFNWVQLPSPKSKWTEIMVLRVTHDRVFAQPYDFTKKAWVTDPSKVLNARILTPPSSRQP